MGPRTADSASKNEKPTKSESCVGPARPRLRSSSDGSIYTRRTVVLRRPVSTEELQTPGGPYIKKIFTIVGDAVGWGFVVRGKQPCYIQAVEPFGPAAAAGMKVRQFVVSVNGLNVLNLDYRTVSHLILTGPRTVVMEVMEERDHWGEEEMQFTQESN
ncbi:DEP domain-containing mTOR-interacting protein-like isoform X2 [Gambusia affinis]|uniref:DEP domain-containing mTOR-interacting protein-like isoform X2 n=1 Tax=Gambusia affinis TaxID=33528 RepID=UPI001CDC2B81|nr:DEP domain-containing mTOR-interacting protein-like isoform X2 [Gambusia affinis]